MLYVLVEMGNNVCGCDENEFYEFNTDDQDLVSAICEEMFDFDYLASSYAYFEGYASQDEDEDMEEYQREDCYIAWRFAEEDDADCCIYHYKYNVETREVVNN